MSVEKEPRQPGFVPRRPLMWFPQYLRIHCDDNPVSFGGQCPDPYGVVDARSKFIVLEDDFDRGISMFENPDRETQPLWEAPVEEKLHAASNWRS
jgi:hypothetical protein